MDIREEKGAEGTDEEYPFPNGVGEADYDWRTVFEAPDYSALIAARQSRRGKEYSTKVNSMLKALTLASMQAGDYPDAAALLDKGPPFSNAIGQLADKNKWVADAIDMLTSPSSPALMAIVTGIALAAQLARNHENQIKEIPNARKRAKAIKRTKKETTQQSPPRFTIRFLRWQIPVRFNSRFKVSKLFAGIRTQTQDPGELTMRVFTDEKLIDALARQGFKLVHNADAPQ